MPPEKRKMLRNMILSITIMLLVILLLYDNAALYYKKQESRSWLLISIYWIAWLFALAGSITIAAFFRRNQSVVYSFTYSFICLGCLTSELLFVINAVSLHSTVTPCIYIAQWIVNVILGFWMLTLFVLMYLRTDGTTKT